MSAQTIGRYVIERELGRGGMAVVYLARDPYIKRQVAVKVLPRQFTFDPGFRARFQREAEVIAALEHPFIVPIFDFGEHEEQPFIVMRYMPGGSLLDAMRRRPLGLSEIVRHVERVAEALDEAHARGIVHRDLKPGNILFDGRGEAFLSDFGIAKITQGVTTASSTGILGTPAYMSPEQARGVKELDGRSDVYALGIILFEMLTGRLPYEADTPMGMAVAHITEPVPSILTLKPDLPPHCTTLITRALAKDPAERYPTAGALARDARLLAGMPDGGRGPAPGADLVQRAPPAAERGTLPPPAPATDQARGPARPPPPAPPTVTPPRAASRAWLAAVVAGLLLCGAFTIGGGALAVSQFANRTSTEVPTPTVIVTTPAPPAAETPGAVVVPPVETETPTALPATATEPDAPSPTPTPTDVPPATPTGAPPGHIVYVCFDGNDDEICWMNADGSGRVQLTDNEIGDFYPSLSPDGRQVYFSRQIRGSNYEIFRMDVDGANVVQITANGAQNYAPSLSPDGTRIVFTSTQGGGAQQVWLMDANGSDARSLAPEGESIDPEWAPDGERITFASTRSGERQIWIMEADGANARQITAGADMGGRNALAPDGRTLAFYAGQREARSRNIYTIQLDGSGLRQLTFEGDNLAPSFSPDGAWIVFASFRDGNNEIYVMRADGSDVLNLTRNPGSDYQPRWGP